MRSSAMTLRRQRPARDEDAEDVVAARAGLCRAHGRSVRPNDLFVAVRDAPGDSFDAAGLSFDLPDLWFDVSGPSFDVPGASFDVLDVSFDVLEVTFDLFEVKHDLRSVQRL